MLTPAIVSYVNKKISSVEKYLEKSVDIVAQVEVGRSTKHHKSGDIFRAEVHIIGAGLDLYAVSEQIDLYAAIDIVKDEIANSILHTKEKKEAMTRKGARLFKNMIRGFNFFKRNK